MTSWATTDKDSQKAIRELWHESDRSAAIIGATIVENWLELAIKTKLRQPTPERRQTKKNLEDIFRPSGPFGPFSTKIQFGYLIHLFDEIVSRELETIKNIRNTFAHKLSVKDFETQKISDLSKNLKIIEKYYVTLETFEEMKDIGNLIGSRNPEKFYERPKTRYLTSCGLYSRLLADVVYGGANDIVGDGPSPQSDNS